MSATFSWVVEYMQCKPTEGQYTDVVITAGWRCNGIQNEGTEELPINYTGTTFGTCEFSAPEGSFTPYADLTQEQVLGWCYANGVDQAVQEAAVQTQIDAKINPPIVQPALPWSA